MVNDNSSIAIDSVKPQSNLNCNAVDAYGVSNVADLLHNVSMNCSEFVLANDGSESVVGELMNVVNMNRHANRHQCADSF